MVEYIELGVFVEAKMGKYSDRDVQNAKETIERIKKEKFVKSFETGEKKCTSEVQLLRKGGAQVFYGEPVFDENRKLQGFNMFTFKMMSDGSMSYRSDNEPYFDENGKQITFSVDEYLAFEKEKKERDDRFGSVMERAIVAKNDAKKIEEILPKIKKNRMLKSAAKDNMGKPKRNWVQKTIAMIKAKARS
ncbi:MAG: hypothetical protein E7012_01355 [Alphaproteobacteria bacterium]|nr:hypothetical protein [Alphaproteobacteria bacterium]